MTGKTGLLIDVRRGIAETPGESDLLLDGDVLLAEEQHAVPTQRVIDAAIVEVIVDNPSRAVGHVNAVLGALECVLIRNRGGSRHLVVHVELAKDEEIVGMELADRLKHFVVHLRLVFKRFSHLPHRSDIEILHCHIRERDFFGWLVPDLHIGGNNVMLERRKYYAAVQRLRISSVAKMLIA